MQEYGKHQAVFSRHLFNTTDVYLRNVTARVDRSAIFMSPLNILLSDFDACILTIRFAGKAEAFERPDASSTLIVTGSGTDWKMESLDFRKDTSVSIPTAGLVLWSVTFDLAALRQDIPAAFLNTSQGVVDWTHVRLEQPIQNPPLIVGLNLSVRRPSFAFAVNKAWPPGRPDVTDDPADVGLEWPEETFEFATTAGETSGTLQVGGGSETATEGAVIKGPTGRWIWEAPLDRVWTNPKQPSQGLRDPLMDDIDESLA